MSKEYDITIIGAGPGGYVAALKAAKMGARVAIIEKGHLGGTCLNVGCIPSKALLASSELLHKIRGADALGVKVSGGVEFDWTQIQKRKDRLIRKLRGGIKGLLGAGDVTLMNGSAAFKAAGTIAVTSSEGQEELIQTKNTIIATGSVPTRVPAWPSDPQWVCTSDEALHWKELPKRPIPRRWDWTRLD
jgi:dihydrolipoamide dehydrogenase